MSIDGFIADANGSVDWLLPYQTLDYGYTSFLGSIDTLVYGRKTYEFELSIGPWPHGGKRRAFVVSSTLPSVSTPDTVLYKRDVAALVAELRKMRARAWVVGGAKLMGAFLDEDGVDLIDIHVIPTILGAGLPAWPQTTRARDMRCISTRRYENGVVHLAYVRP